MMVNTETTNELNAKSTSSLKARRRFFLIFAIIFAIILLGFLLPENRVMPVQGATVNDWNKDAFWYEPWGRSGVHKGIDIFAKYKTKMVSTTGGIVLYEGYLSLGGNVVLILGPNWRLHYYAHLESISVRTFDLIHSNEKIGAVGDSGNAKGKPAHLHYSIVTLFPYIWKATSESQGWKRIFYIDPGEFILQGQ